MTKALAGALALPGGAAISGGPDQPNVGGGTNLPVGSYFFATDGTLWKKTNANPHSWVQIRTIAAANGDSMPIRRGMAVASSGDMIVRATNTTEPGAGVIGICVGDAAPTLTAQYLPWDLAYLDETDWDGVTGGSGGLIPGATYYLDAGLGMLTTTPPSLPGSFLVEIGKAASSTGLIVRVRRPIRL